MRTDWKVAAPTLAVVLAVGLAIVLGAFGRHQAPPAVVSEELKKDLATVSAPGGDLAIAGQSYRRMRFVSGIERSKVSARVKGPKVSHHHERPAASSQATAEATTNVALDPVTSMASDAPAPVATPEAPAPEPAIVIAQRPSPAPVSAPQGSSEGSGVGDRGHGGGLGGLLGGLIGAVIIRGGHGGIDKCDPRTDGRANPTVIDRPDFGMPLPTGQTFPRSRQR
jgi:hypothetical protein